MPIATVPGSEIDVQTPTTGVKLDAGALNVRSQGTRALAAGAEAIGDAAEGIGAQIEKARNVRIAADADLKMRSARQSFLESLQGDSDESTWVDRAREITEGVKDDILDSNGKIGPAMRGELDNAFRSWRGSLAVETQTLAHVQTVNRAWGKTKEDYAEKLRDGDAAGALDNLRVARQTKLADPAEIDKLEREISPTIARNYIENGLRANPKGTKDLLESGASLPVNGADGKPIVPSKVLDADEMKQLSVSARTQTAAWQRGNFEAMVADETDDVTGYIPNEVIRSKMASGEIDEIAGRNKIAAQDKRLKTETAESARTLKAEDTNKRNLVMANARDTNAWGTNPEVYAHDLMIQAADIADPLFQKQAIDSINEHLASVKKSGQALERPVESKIYKQMNDDLESSGAMIPLSVTESAGQSARTGLVVGLGAIGSRAATPGSTTYASVPGGLAEIKSATKMTDEQIELLYGKGVKREDVVQAAQVHNARLQEEMRQWFSTEEGQKATFEQANAHRMEVERPYVLDAVRATLSKKAPANVTTKEEYDLLPAGANYVFNGGPVRVKQ